ncbi:MAG3450 family membrane protein [Mycoplasmopsis primatum]|uniref:MAG3450 family membrane protein n=1 Tax=Mycoplasmopsis primatum TaxID=55604 RepID=UPI0006897B30|nr:hypothetical protein [Mycoplasmopsis primatum]
MNKKQKRREKNNNFIAYGPFLTILFNSIFVIIPMASIWVLVSPEFNNVKIHQATWIILVPLLISIFALLINFLFVYFKIISIRSFNFTIPSIFIFYTIIWFNLAPIEYWIKYIIAPILGIISAIIINIIIGKIEDYLEYKTKANLAKAKQKEIVELKKQIDRPNENEIN